MGLGRLRKLVSRFWLRGDPAGQAAKGAIGGHELGVAGGWEVPLGEQQEVPGGIAALAADRKLAEQPAGGFDGVGVRRGQRFGLLAQQQGEVCRGGIAGLQFGCLLAQGQGDGLVSLHGLDQIEAPAQGTHALDGDSHAGMVIVAGDPCIGLMFGSDRYGRKQKALCVGIEAWEATELDLTTAEH